VPRALVLLLSLFSVFGADPDFNGVWVETHPESGPPMRLQLIQNGTQVQVRMSYRDHFSADHVDGVANVENGVGMWSEPIGCSPRYQHPGFDYRNPGVNTTALSLADSTDPGEPGPLLVYTQEIRWNAPCANNHPIGTERLRKILRRQ
jgi:hypothetical protein